MQEIMSGINLNESFNNETCYCGDATYISFNANIKTTKGLLFTEQNIRIGTNVFIGKNSKIFANSTIKDNSMIHENCIIGDNTLIRNNVAIGNNTKIGSFNAIEPHAIIGSNCRTQGFCMISEYSIIGDNNFLGPHFNNPADNTIGKPEGEYIANPAKIGNNCRFGSGTRLKPGIVIANGTITGAMSYITKNTEENCMYYGIPAIKIKKVEQ